MVVGEARSLPWSGAPEHSPNIRLDWKGLPRTNTLAYYENQYITAVKKFYSTGPRSALDECKIGL
jgi:hypothetical protein